MVELHLAKVVVESSNLFARSIFKAPTDFSVEAFFMIHTVASGNKKNAESLFLSAFSALLRGSFFGLFRGTRAELCGHSV